MFLLLFIIFGSVSSNTVKLSLESGMYAPSRLAIRIPETSGTNFDIVDEAGSSFNSFARVEAQYKIAKHFITFLFAPLKYYTKALLTKDISFNGTNFNKGVNTDFYYKFNSYRLGYLYQIYKSNNLDLRIGITLKLRDAYIELVQGNKISKNSNLGFVPLLDFEMLWNVYKKLVLRFDVDGLGAPQGYAIDATLQFLYNFNDNFGAFVGYRILDGGANVSVYTFATFQYITAGLVYGI